MTKHADLRLAVITGSAREGHYGELVTRWLLQQVHLNQRFEPDLIDLRDFELPWLRPAYASEPAEATAALLARLAAADSFVVITPEYNHGYPAALKHAIDLGYSEWHAKPAGFVSYGGMSGGLRAVEQLRQVFAELHAVGIRDGVSFHRVEEQFEADGTPREAAGLAAAAQAMLAQLEWWARALQEARRQRPYTAGRGRRQAARQATVRATAS